MLEDCIHNDHDSIADRLLSTAIPTDNASPFYLTVYLVDTLPPGHPELKSPDTKSVPFEAAGPWQLFNQFTLHVKWNHS